MIRKRIGIYNGNMGAGGGGEKRCAVLAERLSHQHDVLLIVSESPPIEALEKYFAVNLSRVKLVHLRLPVHEEMRGWLCSGFKPALQRARFDLFLRQARRVFERFYFQQIRELELDLFINNQAASILPCPAPAGIYMCMFPHDRRGELRYDHGRGPLFELYATLGNPVVGMTDEVLDSYDVITANSSFTAHWVRHLWRRPAEVVYTACEDMGPPAPKEKIILHVGRFVCEERNDNKRQQVLIEAFRSMDQLHRDGWELHLAGSVLPGEANRRFLDRLTEMARRAPIRMHPSASFEELRSLYRRASIYWHATGYGTPVERHPGKHEHFGITTVEAMSAGCVPVVINTGGQAESVVHGECGFLWSSLAELEGYTCRLAEDARLRAVLGERAMERSMLFRRSLFADRVEAIADRLLHKAASTSVPDVA
jgi:glycosyltransferase involved in cell wall biosynthesis